MRGTYPEGDFFDLVFITFPPKPGQQKRVNGHVIMLMGPTDDENFTTIVHASTSRGFIKERIGPGHYLYEHITAVRKLRPRI